ncbi:MAG TPA: hypothetical protein VJ507_02175 [Candidatus Bathyarchaeia archaeon]|nr:hypothetical protein [Candidatus Bathyarchaeia archaeon]
MISWWILAKAARLKGKRAFEELTKRPTEDDLEAIAKSSRVYGEFYLPMSPL